MPYIVNRKTLEVTKIDENTCLRLIHELTDFDILSDTEYTERLTMIIDCIGMYSPLIYPEGTIIWTYKELNKSFNPIIDYIKLFSDKPVVALSESEVNEMVTELEEISEWVQNLEGSGREVKRQFEEALTSGEYDSFLSRWGLSRKALKHTRKHNQSNVEITPQKVKVELKFFFEFADLFKVWGKEWQAEILKGWLIQFRTLRFQRYAPTFYVFFNDVLIEIVVELREIMYRFPPRKKGLADQAKTFGLEQAKMDIAKVASEKLGMVEADVYKNMTYVRENLLEEFLRYNAIDLFTTSDLDLIQQEFLQIIEDNFGLDHDEIKDTTGANVATFLKRLVYSHYGAIHTDLVNRQLKLTRVDSLQDIPLNNYGIQPFMTVGGLLYTRMAHHPFLKGKFGDLDLSSCYATLMSLMNIYIGEPVTLTFKYKRYKPTLREIIEFVNTKQIANDAWLVRVSGKFKEAINTLILSDLRFTPKKVTKNTKWDLKGTKKLVTNFNRDKTSKKLAVSTLLTKEVKFGLVNADLWECIKLLPPAWVEEYLDLQCEVLAYHPPELIVDTVEEFNKIVETLPEESYTEKFDARNGLSTIVSQYHKGNVCLRFPVSDYWGLLKSKREEHKSVIKDANGKVLKASNPVQEVFKLFLNSGYGVLACLYLATTNLMASNYITAGARANAWLMVNALNGFGAITDGTGFDWERIPLGKTFREVLALNPSYLTHFDISLNSGLSDANLNQKWIDENFNSHLANYYELPSDHYLVKRFKYELKTEKFTAKENDVESTVFSRYANTNAGNYAKGIEGYVLIDKTEYDFNSQESYVKARSFPGNDNKLIKHFVSSLEDKYVEPFVCEENKIIKFGDGNALAIKFLSDGIEKIAHPMGFSTTAYKIMKLISRSQFLFPTERSLKNFETNEENLLSLSKELLPKSYWSNLPVRELEAFGVEIIPNIDYFAFSKSHPVGVGFELLALAPRAKGDLKGVRITIDEKVQSGCENFNAGLSLNKYKKLGEKFKNLFASIIIRKANAEYRLKQRLIEASSEPTILTLTQDHLTTVAEVWGEVDDD